MSDEKMGLDKIAEVIKEGVEHLEHNPLVDKIKDSGISGETIENAVKTIGEVGGKIFHKSDEGK